MTTNERASQSLSTDLEMLLARAKGESLTLAEVKQSLKGRGSAMLLVLLALPFCFVAIPGLSTPFGIAICLIGACLVIGREPCLPRFIMRRRLSSARLAQLLTGAIKVARKLENFVRRLPITSRSSHGRTTRGSSMTVEVFYPGDDDPDGEALRSFAQALLIALEPILPLDRAEYHVP